MKQLLLIAIIMMVIISCKKKEETTAPTTPGTAITDVAGNWTVKVYDGNALTSPAAGSLELITSSSYYSSNSSHFDITFDGTNHNIEDGTYTTSADLTKITFTKTGGGYSVLSGGNTWTINILNANTLKITSASGLVIECNK